MNLEVVLFVKSSMSGRTIILNRTLSLSLSLSLSFRFSADILMTHASFCQDNQNDIIELS